VNGQGAEAEGDGIDEGVRGIHGGEVYGFASEVGNSAGVDSEFLQQSRGETPERLLTGFT
jgi:hypothetical protein